MELQLITSYTPSFQDLIFRIVEKQQRSKLQKTTTATRLIKELLQKGEALIRKWVWWEGEDHYVHLLLQRHPF